MLIHRYWTAEDLVVVQRVCEKRLSDRFVVGREGHWTCVETKASSLDVDFLAEIGPKTALGLLAQSTANVIDFAIAKGGLAIAQVSVLESQSERRGDPALLPPDELKDFTSIIEWITTTYGIDPYADVVGSVVAPRPRHESFGIALMLFGMVACVTDGLMHPVATATSLVGMFSTFCGVVLWLRNQKLLVRLGTALLASIAQEAVLFGVASSIRF